MYRLAGTDAAMLYAETSEAPMNACTLTILDPSTAPTPFTIEHFRELMLARGDRLEPFRQRLAAVPLGMDWPVWVDAGSVDMHAHIHPARVRRPGAARQVAELISDLITQPLPHDRPLWQCWFIEGLENGYVAIFCQLHHALLGGTRAMAMYELLFDLTPEVSMEPARPASAERAPSPLAVTSHLAWSIVGTPVRMARTARDIAGAAVGVARFRTSELWPDAVRPYQAPSTSLNGRIDAARHCAYSTISLTDVKTVKRAFGVTVNDVVLAVCGGALRSYLHERGEEPRGSLSASVPVSVDAGGGGSGGSVIGNAVANFGATLATDVADPVERLRRVAASTRAAKGLHAALGPEAMLRLADILPPGLSGAAMRTMSSPRLAAHTPPAYNVIVSNLPGPPVPLYSGGARLVASHVFGPLIQGLGLNITVLSYVDSIDVGINACPGLVPDPWLIADGVPAALDELLTAVTN